MKHRVSYIAKSSEDIAPEQFEVIGTKSVRVHSLRAAKEHRITIPFSQLSHKLTRLVKSCHQLHLRWTSPSPYTPEAPFSSKVSPGLHIFLNPHGNHPIEGLCSALKQIFSSNMKCEDFQTTFSPSIASPRSAHANSYQYFSNVLSLANFVRFVQQELCLESDQSCRLLVTSSLRSDYLDIDFDAGAHALVVTIFWNRSPDAYSWQETIESNHNDRVEVGIFREEATNVKGEIKLNGWLAVVGENEKPAATRFSFASRHHTCPEDGTFPKRPRLQVSLDSPRGLHPNLRISLPSNGTIKKPYPTCALHMYLTIPSYLFIDRYQFVDPIALASHQLVALRTINGAVDLEAPDWSTKLWGSAVLVELEAPEEISTSQWTPVIPLHLRYLFPNQDGYFDVPTPSPVFFWACRSAEYGLSESKMSVNPFDRVSLGYDGFFGDHVMFFHLESKSSVESILDTPQNGSEVINTLKVPTLRLDAAYQVGPVTLSVMLLAFAWVISSLFVSYKRPMDRRREAKKD